MSGLKPRPSGFQKKKLLQEKTQKEEEVLKKTAKLTTFFSKVESANCTVLSPSSSLSGSTGIQSTSEFGNY